MQRLIVFDLDLTLWHCGPLLWCDQLTPPLRQTASGQIMDTRGTEILLYPEVPEILADLSSRGILMGLASRTSAPKIARQLLGYFGLDNHFPHQQIYPGDKATHFQALHEQTGIPYEEMVFFDDEERNIHSVSRLGVRAHLVTSGMSRHHLSHALGF